MRAFLKIVLALIVGALEYPAECLMFLAAVVAFLYYRARATFFYFSRSF